MKAERQKVVKGEVCVTNEERNNLTDYDDAWLRGMSDGSQERDRLKKLETDLAIAKNSLCDKVHQKRKRFDDLNSELDGMIRDIGALSKRRIVGEDSDDVSAAVLRSDSIPDTTFGAEVKAWISDMQT